jgi:hypothetical protein
VTGQETWRDLLAEEMRYVGDETPISELRFSVPAETLDVIADENYELRFTAWSPSRVYFACDYDTGCRVWVQSVPREPCDESTLVDEGQLWSMRR